MKWSKDKPTKPGCYWRKAIGPNVWHEENPTVIELRNYTGKLCHINWEPIWEKYLWAGPIPMPED